MVANILKKMVFSTLYSTGNVFSSFVITQRKNVLPLLWCVVIVTTGLFSTGRASAADFEHIFEDDTKIPWRMTADQKVVYDEETDQLMAHGNVVIEKKDIKLIADEIRYDRVTKTAYAEGNVRMTIGEDLMVGDRLEMNLEGETGALHDGTLFIKKSNLHIKADKIQKTGARTYVADRVQITSCDGDAPVWDITGKKLDVTVEGYGFVKHAALRVKNVPVLYSPFLSFPVMLKRQTGLLDPQIGSSDRKGFEYTQPFFWAINDSSDATFYADLMSRRGGKFGIEYRYIFSEDSKGAVLFDFLDDQKVDDDTGTNSKDYGYADDNTLRPNSDRYWFRMKHDHWFDSHTVAKVDLDVVSDQDYLQEFKSGYTGFNDTRSFFNRFLNRELDDYNDPVRKNQFVFNKLWPGYSLNAAVVWWDDVIARRMEEFDNTAQQLPTLSFERYKQPILNSPLYLGIESRYSYFYREDGAEDANGLSKDGTKGHRIDLYPRLYLPYRIGNMLTIEPSVGLRQTVWHIDTYDDVSVENYDATADKDETPHRELYDFKLELFSEIYNTFQAPFKSEDKIKHAVRFQTDYEYIPELNQKKYPLFDSIDRIEGKNLITYSMTNTFTRRTQLADHASYHQFARLKLEQSFDVTKENDSVNEPFTPLRGEFQCDFGRWFYLQADAEWSTYSSQFTSRNIAGRLADKRGDRLFIEHRYTKSLNESILIDALVRLTPKVWLFADYERNVQTGDEIGSGMGILYQSQCWSIEVQYEKEDDDQAILFVVTLHGLGDIGSGRRHSGIRPYTKEDWF
jgi:LPS-assembly protein